MLSSSSETAAVQVAECRCCGMWEECTLDYIDYIKHNFCGVWVCGLCAEAIKDEQLKHGVDVKAALMVHAKFRQISAVDPTLCVARSLLQLFRKLVVTTTTTSTSASSTAEL